MLPNWYANSSLIYPPCKQPLSKNAAADRGLPCSLLVLSSVIVLRLPVSTSCLSVVTFLGSISAAFLSSVFTVASGRVSRAFTDRIGKDGCNAYIITGIVSGMWCAVDAMWNIHSASVCSEHVLQLCAPHVVCCKNVCGSQEFFISLFALVFPKKSPGESLGESSGDSPGESPGASPGESLRQSSEESPGESPGESPPSWCLFKLQVWVTLFCSSQRVHYIHHPLASR